MSDNLKAKPKGTENVLLLSFFPRRKVRGTEGATLYRTQGRADENFSDTNKRLKTNKKMQS